jgi:pSer/pThr/pTyr-binding forkhead associated (FHA) protein
MHCLIVRTDGLLFIRDLGSTNGTKVNGQRVVRGALLPGDELAFAGEKFRVEMGPGEPDLESEEHVQNAATEVIQLPFQAPDLYVDHPAESFSNSDSDVVFLPE